MKASPVRPGDYLELFAEIDLLGALSACPGGDCSAEHSSDAAACHPLRVENLRPPHAAGGLAAGGAERLRLARAEAARRARGAWPPA